MRRSVTSSIAAACLALAASAAHASDVLITGFTFNPAVNISVSSPNFSGPAGQFTGTLDGASFTTYCTDLLQSFGFGTLYTDYSVVDGVAAWGAQKSSDLDRAFSAFAFYGAPASAETSAVAQAIVWEILNETSGTYDLNSGSFVATSANATTQLAFTNSAAIFADIASKPITVHADQLYSRSHQDFVVLTPVPEPSTYALMLAGLAGIGFVARRRRPR
jgi:hypothetical protein